VPFSNIGNIEDTELSWSEDAKDRRVMQLLQAILTALGGGSTPSAVEYSVTVQTIAAGNSVTVSGAVSFEAVTTNDADFTVNGQTVTGAVVDGIGAEAPSGVIEDTVIAALTEDVLLTYTVAV